MQENPTLTLLESHLTGELIGYACGRAIFCPSCDTILDRDDAVLYTPRANEGTSAILCGSCSDSMRDSLRPIDEAVLLARTDIYDGRRYA